MKNCAKLLFAVGLSIICLLGLILLPVGIEANAGTASTASPKAKSTAGTAWLFGWGLKEPMEYDLSKGANLEAAIRAAFGGRLDDLRDRDNNPDIRVRLTRFAKGKETNTLYYILKMTPAQREAVILVDGDTVDFSKRIL